jgi:hypothetical protein
VRLRNSGSFGHAALGDLAASQAMVQIIDQPAVKVLERHQYPIFPGAIGEGLKVIPMFNIDHYRRAKIKLLFIAISGL